MKSLRLGLCLLLAVVCASLTLSSGTQARLEGTERVLYQVTTQGWTRAITGWTRHQGRSWTVAQGTLTSTGKGRKVCDYDEGVKYCRYQAVIISPYHVTTRNYAIEAEIQFVGNNLTTDFFGGMVLRAHGTWPAIGPAVLAGRSGFFATCGNAAGDGGTLGMCAFTGDLSIDGPIGLGLPIWKFQDNGGWHRYRVEVQGQQYRLLIDGHEMEDVTDGRPAGQLSGRFGFFETADPLLPGSLIRIRRVTVLALTPAPTPTPTATLGPAAGSWHTATPMPTARWGLAAATGKDGRIYAVGGAADSPSLSELNLVEAFDPSAKTWACSAGDPSPSCSSRTIAPMPTARHWLAAARGPDGKIYALGGASGGDFALTIVEAYDPATNSWSCSVGDSSPGCASRTIAPLPTGRSSLAAAAGADGRIYAIGGQGCECGHTVEAYTPSTNTWTPIAPTKADHGWAAAAMGQDGRIFVVGGCCQQGVQPPAGVAEVYDPPRNVWRIIAPIPAGRSPMAAAAGSDGRIYAIGGTLPCCFGPPTLNMVDVYDPGTDRWETVAPVPTARQDLAAVIGSDGRIYAIGGRSVAEENFNTVEAYTPSGQ